MEKKLSLNWYIYNNEASFEERYCHNCGAKVIFKDSLKRRQNANGKNIFYFAIYKCPKGHTWNKQLDSFKALSGLENMPEEEKTLKNRYEEVNMKDLISSRTDEVEIFLEKLEVKVRIDKFLSTKLQGLSRGDIVKMITEGSIKVNEKIVKAKSILKEKDVIKIVLSKY
ncbi:cytoplasmic protein [Clostridium sp. 19966]|uniref:S4 domain-containing protein n=1 Tax=Clostridium sp. 19966 TaxID=2768166 RepID=UPI0028E038AA|nr:S4 domain-containing protein [Clostridium sp. 19966]MDT8717819.1 cytoplasmic protein [Clostridium sp. 19966]